MIEKALDGKPYAGNSHVRRDGGHKLPLLGCALLAALNAGAGVLQLSSDTTWTDLSALTGYDGVEVAIGRVWRGDVRADKIVLPPNEAALFEVK